MAYFTSGLAQYPIIPGHEWSGEVLAVGAEVRDLKPGDKVVGECTAPCERVACCRRGWYNQCTRRRETGILHLDGAATLHRFEKLSFEEASLCETTVVSLYAIKLAEVTPADGVAVLGPGPIDLQALQAARAYGARQVVMIGGRPGRRELALRWGADAAIDPRSQDLVRETLRFT